MRKPWIISDMKVFYLLRNDELSITALTDIKQHLNRLTPVAVAAAVTGEPETASHLSATERKAAADDADVESE